MSEANNLPPRIETREDLELIGQPAGSLKRMLLVTQKLRQAAKLAQRMDEISANFSKLSARFGLNLKAPNVPGQQTYLAPAPRNYSTRPIRRIMALSISSSARHRASKRLLCVFRCIPFGLAGKSWVMFPDPPNRACNF
jgi:hypothetical protein